MIRLATMRDIDAVETMYRELLTHEARYGSNSNWVLDLYPTRETAVNGCLEQTLYVLLDEGVFCASMILNQLQPVEYKKIKWAYPAAPEDILVIHTLYVPPQQVFLATKVNLPCVDWPFYILLSKIVDTAK